METCKVNSILMAYERTGTGPPLLLVHGYPLDHSIWEPVIPLLQDTFELILPDLRGFGQSEVASAGYSIEDMADDLAGLLNHLQIERVYIAGHSMGGYIALAFARLFPQRVQGLALVASHPYADPPDRKDARYITARAVLEQGVEIVATSMPEKLTNDGELQQRLAQLIRQQPPESVAGALKAMAERSDLTAFLSGVEFPFVVVHGMRDELFPVDFGQSAHDLISSVLVTGLPDVGHMPMMEAPLVTAEALKSFLSV